MGAVSDQLDLLKEDICNEIYIALKTFTSKASYTTVWRDFEDVAIEHFKKIARRLIPSLEPDNFDSGEKGSEKNRLADLEIEVGGESIAICIKAARKDKSPANDLGTFHQYPTKKKRFTASFDIWVRYDDSGSAVIIDKVFFDRSYKFVGEAEMIQGGVKYRKKDGNMRPKPWRMFDQGVNLWKTAEAFDLAVKKSERFRANELVKEHLETMTEDDQRVLYEVLKRKFHV